MEQNPKQSQNLRSTKVILKKKLTSDLIFFFLNVDKMYLPFSDLPFSVVNYILEEATHTLFLRKMTVQNAINQHRRPQPMHHIMALVAVLYLRGKRKEATVVTYNIFRK